LHDVLAKQNVTVDAIALSATWLQMDGNKEQVSQVSQDQSSTQALYPVEENHLFC